MITSDNRLPPLPGDGLRAPTNRDVRAMLREWQRRNQWAWADMSDAMRSWGLKNIPGAARLEAFSKSGMHTLHEDSLRSVRRFLLTFPDPAPYQDIREQLETERSIRAKHDHERSLRESIARERERSEHRRYWLAREAAVNGRPADRARPTSNPLFGLDKATIRALSGGTL